MSQNHSSITIFWHTLFCMSTYGPIEHRVFGILAKTFQLFRVHQMVSPLHSLLDDVTFIQVYIDVVGGPPD